MSWLNPFKREDKFLMQMSVDLGNGVNAGMSVNLPVTSDIQTLHRTLDLMRRVQDRQRAITELPVFEQKLEILEAQRDSTKKMILTLTTESEQEAEKWGAPKTGTTNALDNNKQNLERMEADIKLGRLRVENIRKRITTDEVTAEDIAELNKLSVAA